MMEETGQKQNQLVFEAIYSLTRNLLSQPQLHTSSNQTFADYIRYKRMILLIPHIVPSSCFDRLDLIIRFQQSASVSHSRFVKPDALEICHDPRLK